jgi:Lamin Tail Domain/PKD domain/CotH kinase protein
MERMVDTDRAAIYTAVRGYLADWDNFTRDRGKNGYLYRRPTDGKFEFHHWDSDLGWQTGRINDAFIGTAGGIGWTNYSNRPWFQQRFRHYLAQLITRYTGGSPRTGAWLTAMNYQSGNAHANAPFKTSAYNYATTWFPTRDANATTLLGAANLNLAFSITSANNQTVATPVFNVTGNASLRTAYVEVVGHPEAVFTWNPSAGLYSPWAVNGLRLQNGLNALTVRAIGGDGAVLATLPFNVTLSVNAPPVVALTATPPSLRIEAGEQITVDATASTDPEGTALTYAWAVNPTAGATVAHSVPGKTEARFTIPGIYTISVTLTDGGGATATATREVTVFDADDFTSFGNSPSLPAGWTVQNAELRDNFSASSWYSLEDTTGRLLLQVLDDSAKPLVSTAATHPLVTRDLPDSSDFVLQTEFEPDTREFVSWQSGLWFQLNEGGATVTYTYGLNAGTSLVVNRAALPSPFSAVNTFPNYTGSGATLRVRRSGTSLHFQRYDGAAWVNQHTQTIPAGATALTGGVFAASSAAINVRTSFDYILVADPSNLNAVLAALRITEVHYNPATGGVEYIELRNTGAQPISLAGVYFGDGQPFSVAGVPTTPYTFGNETLAPGEFIVVTENNTSFQALYGNTARLAPAWTAGNLSNGGERITLHDASGNVIHDFTYDDIAPWPLAADGTGPSMEVINLSGDYNDGTNWRASGEPAGSPGYQGLGPDTDGDGYPDSIESLFGTGANDRNSSPLATAATNASGHVTVAWPFTADAVYDVEYSADLISWSVLQTITGTGTWTDTATAVNQRRCYRVTARLP